VGLDMLDDNYDPRIKRWHLESLRGREGFRFLELDLASAEPEAYLDGVEAVFHLAARPGVRESWGESFRVYDRQNVLATQRLLEGCVRHRIRRFVYASSSSVYGEMPGHPVTEEEPKRPLSPYGVSKLAAEHLVMAYHRVFGLPTVSLRYFTVYGPRQRPDMAFHRFFRAILTGEEVTVFGDGCQTRDVTYVGDVVQATVAALERGGAGEIYNIGGGRRVSVREVLEIMGELTGRKPRIRHLERPPGDPVHTGADIRRARTELGYDPRTGVREGLTRMAAWMEECLARGY
jgi:UDP-glucose 4-epimerase